MSLDKYEKIDGREALKRLLAGEIVLDGLADEHFLDGTKLARIRKSGAYEIANDGLRGILERDWYIPKPFDVRQAMLDRPNEWVGAYEFSGNWFKVGFDNNHMVAIETGFKNDVPVMYHNEFVDHVEAIMLNTCIPIEDVPEEATR